MSNGRRFRVLVFVSSLCVSTLAGAFAAPLRAPGGATETDADGDGLCDFHEIHKYLTDPNLAATADGIADADERRRREFNYSVRAVIRVMPPYNLAALDDDYQDVRVLAENADFVELEVVVYPFNTNAEAIEANRDWKTDYASMEEYLAPGITTNWDDAMRDDLLRELSEDGIDPFALPDKEAVEQVSRWLFGRSKYRYMFCTYYADFVDGTPRVLPGLEVAFEREKGDKSWNVTEQFNHELFGKEMFAAKSHGTCTSTAIYQTTVLRALGIPTRMVLCIPLADGSDQEQVEMVAKGLTHHRVRRDACLGALAGGAGFASHTFCEVYVGGRWRRLNYTTLGQNVLAPNYLGLMIKVHVFNDLSEANLAPTWGVRYAKGLRDDVFRHANPYRLLEVGDHFGEHSLTPNSPADFELENVTIDNIYWPRSPQAPDHVRKLDWNAEPGSGRLFVHCREWLETGGDYLQYKLFMRRGSRLRAAAKDHADVSCRLSSNFVTQRSRKLCELEIVDPPAEYAKMVNGVPYALHALNGRSRYRWTLGDGLTLTRE